MVTCIMRVLPSMRGLGSQLFLKGQTGCSGAAEPPMMTRLSPEVLMEREGWHRIISNEVKAKEVITR